MSYVGIVQEMVPLTFYLYRFVEGHERPVQCNYYDCYADDINLQNKSLFQRDIVFLSKDQRRLLPEHLLAKGWKHFFKAMTFFLHEADYPPSARSTEGRGKRPNMPEAIRRMRELAIGGMNCLPAQYFLASCYQLAMFVDRDIDLAYEYNVLAAQHNFLNAQLKLAQLYYHEYNFRMKKRVYSDKLLEFQQKRNKHAVVMYQMNALEVLEKKSTEHDKSIQKTENMSDKEILEASVQYYKLADQNPIHVRTDEMAVMKRLAQKEAKERDMSFQEVSRKSILGSVLFCVEHATLDNISKIVQVWLYGFKDCFIDIYEDRYDNNLDALALRNGADLLYKNMDLPFDLLPRETLIDLLEKLASMIHKAMHFDPNNLISSGEEVLNSYLEDLPVMLKKSKKKKAPPSKKAQKPIVTVKQVPLPNPVEIPEVVIPKNIKQAPPPVKKVLKKEKIVQNEIAKNHQAIKDIFTKLAELEAKMQQYYIEKSKPGMKKKFQALFDKDDMSFHDVNDLLIYIAESENGSTRLLASGNGMNLLTLGEFTCGGHRPHHGETNVDRGALTSLRSVLSSHYSVKIHGGKLI